MSKLNERRRKILWAIIQSYIDLNVPIGSMLITQRFPVDLSSATIRNTMAQLEEMGYISQPHTSAGRIPTEKGYRFYVDMLLEEKTLTLNTALSDELASRLRVGDKDNNILIKEAAKTLSLFSKYLAIATPPRLEIITLKRIKIVKYENKKVLAILIYEDGAVKNKIFELDRVYSQKKLDKAASYFNNNFSGQTLKKIREKIAYELYRDKLICDELIENLLILCKDILSLESDSLSLGGLSGTSFLPDYATLKQIKEILKAIEDKNFMLKLLNQISDAQGTKVILGMENILPSMRELSMVISTYKNKKLASGAVGIIGPTRMNYKKLIPIVDHTAKALTQILSEI